MAAVHYCVFEYAILTSANMDCFIYCSHHRIVITCLNPIFSDIIVGSQVSSGSWNHPLPHRPCKCGESPFISLEQLPNINPRHVTQLSNQRTRTTHHHVISIVEVHEAWSGQHLTKYAHVRMSELMWPTEHQQRPAGLHGALQSASGSIFSFEYL